MKVAIIDDELHNRLVVKKIIQHNCPSLEIIVEESLIDRAVEAINTKKPDLVFLDIQLKNGTGFDIINKLTYKPNIIFTTAYSEYAIKAIRIQAFDYILKPIDEKELIDSINRCIQKPYVPVNEESGEERSVQGFYYYATSSGKKTINLDEILYFESSGAYTYIISKEDRILLSKNIGEVEKELPEIKFYRTHNSYIVNLAKIKSVDVKRNGYITLLNNDLIPVSQRKMKEFLDLLKTHN